MTSTEVNQIISNLRHSLFTKPTNIDGVSRDVSLLDVTINSNNKDSITETDPIERFGITVNLKPLCKMNKKTWNTYVPEKQVEILRRIQNSYLRQNPSTTQLEIHFESCPIIKQMHFHALIECPSTHITSLINYWDKYSGRLPTDKKPWRHFDYQPIYDEKGWLEYIRKDVQK